MNIHTKTFRDTLQIINATSTSMIEITMGTHVLCNEGVLRFCRERVTSDCKSGMVMISIWVQSDIHSGGRNNVYIPRLLVLVNSLCFSSATMLPNVPT